VTVVGIDVGSTYTKAVLVERGGIAAYHLMPTGFRLEAAAEQALAAVLEIAGRRRDQVEYVVSTGFGRFQVPFRDVAVTDLTAHARGARFFVPQAGAVLDVGGQTMKASRLDERGRVVAFRLNDKCAAGTGAFLEKTARYLGFATEEIGALAATSRTPVPISGVCAVFAESEVINHVSNGAAPADILHGAIGSLVDRSVQLLRRVGLHGEGRETAVVGGILRFEVMARLLAERLGTPVRVPPGELVQLTGALGAALLGARRLERLRAAATTEGIGAAPAAVTTAAVPLSP
jgi:predicted CoA-substrate-specific enzyme activase